MKILGIETSCDETSAAVVENGQDVLSHVVISSLKQHAKYGGVIPEIASRRQLECIQAVVSKSLEDANLSFKDIHAIAVTTTPGLIGSLVVGISFARAFAYALKLPLIEVDHIKAHVYANFLKNPSNKNFLKPKLPAVGLVVSGGHTSLFYLKDFKQFKLLGQTRDDAAGEAFDKVAKILELGYPGGPVIDKMAKIFDPQKHGRINLPASQLPGLEFSFSGLKTSVLYYKRDHEHDKDFSKEALVYYFQERVVQALVEKSLMACQKMKSKTLLVGGGVAANTRLREVLLEESRKRKVDVFFPEFIYCLDNAAMIAGLGYRLYKK